MMKRWGRAVFEAVLILGFAATGFLLYVASARVRSPILPHFFFAHDKDTLIVQGTWRRDDGDDAWPSQTTTIQCERATRRCTQASAVIAGDERLMPIILHAFEVAQWNDSVVIARGSTALCIEETYEFHLTTEAVTGLISRKRSDVCDSGAAQSKSPVRIRMIDGYESSRAARYGKQR